VSVPALVETELFQAVQEQLQENRHHARRRLRGARYLLQGVLTCARCGYAYYGKGVSNKAAKGHQRDYAYYRCLGTDAYRIGGERVCDNLQVRTDLLDAAVWQQVCGLLEEPGRVEQEYQRRSQASPMNRDGTELASLETQIAKRRRGLARLIDSYTEGLIEKSEFEPRITQLRQRLTTLEDQRSILVREVTRAVEILLVVGRLEAFAAQVKGGLAGAGWLARRELIRMLVKRVEVDQQQVRVVFRVDPDPFVRSPEEGLLQDCRRSHLSAPGKHRPAWYGGDDPTSVCGQGRETGPGSLRRRFCRSPSHQNRGR